jgi:hypothetical protein
VPGKPYLRILREGLGPGYPYLPGVKGEPGPGWPYLPAVKGRDKSLGPGWRLVVHQLFWSYARRSM